MPAVAVFRVLRSVGALRERLAAALPALGLERTAEVGSTEGLRALLLRLAGATEDWRTQTDISPSTTDISQCTVETEDGEHGQLPAETPQVRGVATSEEEQAVALASLRRELWGSADQFAQPRVGRELLLIFARYDLSDLDAVVAGEDRPTA